MLAESRVLSRELDIFLKGGSQILGVMSAKPSFRNTGRRWRRMGQTQEMSEEQLYCQEKVPDVQATGPGGLDSRDQENAESHVPGRRSCWWFLEHGPGRGRHLEERVRPGDPTGHIQTICYRSGVGRVRGRWLCCHWCIHRIRRPQPCPEGCW